MNAAATLTCIVAFSSFGWGVLRFFVKPAGPTWRAIITAALGLFFGAWHMLAIATSTTDPRRVALGMAAHIVSGVLFWSAVRACQSRPLTAIFEADLPVRLVQVGPYAYVRHPFYGAYTIFWFGGWVASGSLVALLSVPVMLAIYVHGAGEEERKFSRSPLAQEYADYRQRAGAWLPRLIRRKRNAATAR
jgi:protein-S-isoprenylcysteine O-methyltransferase Ste14